MVFCVEINVEVYCVILYVKLVSSNPLSKAFNF